MLLLGGRGGLLFVCFVGLGVGEVGLSLGLVVGFVDFGIATVVVVVRILIGGSACCVLIVLIIFVLGLSGGGIGFLRGRFGGLIVLGLGFGLDCWCLVGMRLGLQCLISISLLGHASSSSFSPMGMFYLTCFLTLSITLSINSSGHGNTSDTPLSATQNLVRS